MIDTSTTIIRGIEPGRLTVDEREQTLLRRAWTRAERHVVLMGFLGRLSIAIEPLLCGLVFAVITGGVFVAHALSPTYVNKDIVIIAPVFGLGVIASAVWALAVMFAPVRALLHTLRPIYIVDGYIRYRGRDAHSTCDTNGYIGVLGADSTLACEWPTLGEIELPALTRPAVCEFTEYGGVHSIDGRATGVLPARISALGVGISPRKREIIS